MPSSSPLATTYGSIQRALRAPPESPAFSVRLGSCVRGVHRGSGGQIGFPYLDPACNVKVDHNDVTLYKYMFPPQNRHPTLCVVGLIQPWGAIMPISELQCRWAARIFSGKVTGRGVVVGTCQGLWGAHWREWCAMAAFEGAFRSCACRLPMPCTRTSRPRRTR